MSRALRAGAAYALVLLAAGTLLGTLRVLVVAPHLGPGRALWLELPLMLALAWVATGRLLAGYPVPGAAPRAAMAATALVLLLGGEAGLAAALTGTGPAAWLAGLAEPAAWPGLLAQIAACLMPLVRHRDQPPH